MAEEIDILLVEDNVSDVELIREAMAEVCGPHRIELASDGEVALRILAQRQDRPHLIILDLNLPKVSGIEVLRAIKREPRYKAIPVLILTNSTAQDDVARCYNSYANTYLRKPVGYDRLSAMIRSTWEFWIETALIPKPYTMTSIPPSSKDKP